MRKNHLEYVSLKEHNDDFYSLQLFNQSWFHNTVKFFIILVSIADYISNITLIILLVLSEHLYYILSVLFGAAWLASGAVQVSYFISTWDNIRNHYSASTSFQLFLRDARFMILHILGVLPFFRYYQVTTNEIEDRQHKLHNGRQQSHRQKRYELHSTRSFKVCCQNQKVAPWLNDIIPKLELFFLRSMIEGVILSGFLLIWLFFQNWQDSNSNNFNTLDYVERVTMMSLLLKLINVLLSFFVLQINWSYQFSIHIQYADSLACVSDLLRHYWTLIMIIYSIIYDNGNLTLLQLYFYPCTICVILLAIFKCYNAKSNNTLNLLLQTQSPMVANMVGIFYWPFLFICELISCQLKFLFFYDFVSVGFIDAFWLQDINWTKTNCSYVVLSLKTYENYYITMNTISHYLANYENISLKNILSKKNNTCDNVKLNQQIGCLNYQLLRFCLLKEIEKSEKKSKHNHRNNDNENAGNDDNVSASDENKADDDHNNIDNSSKTHLKILTKLFNRLKHLENKNLLDNAIHDFDYSQWSSSSPDSNTIPNEDVENSVNNIVTYADKLYQDILDYVWMISAPDLLSNLSQFARTTKKSFAGTIMRGLFACDFILSRINLILFPLYCWIFISLKDIWNKIVTKGKQLELLIIIMFGLVVAVYIITFYAFIKYKFPLFYKMRHVLPVNMLSKQERHDRDRTDYFSRFFGHFQFEKDTIGKKILNASIEQCQGLQMRPLIEKMVVRHFGKDIGSVLLLYVPLWDDKHYHRFTSPLYDSKLL